MWTKIAVLFPAGLIGLRPSVAAARSFERFLPISVRRVYRGIRVVVDAGWVGYKSRRGLSVQEVVLAGSQAGKGA